MKNYSVRTQTSDDILTQLLASRGMTDTVAIEKFLNPDYDTDIHDPFLLKDMDKAVDRILKAIKDNERIAIFSDYDADGIPGAVVLSDFFKKINYPNFFVYIPHRNDEGYGMNDEATQKVKDDGAKLLITIDCGISNGAEVDVANSLGLDVIITDHHLPKNTLPNAYAVINPKRADCQYPDKNLCGSGVIWKVICAVIQKGKEQKVFEISNGAEKWSLDLVGLATLSDMVPLIGENRVLASYGLKVLRKSPRPGLHKLFQILKVNQADITEDDIAFLITPRINAASRMGLPKDAYDMLFETDVTKAGMMAEHLNRINDERKGVVGSMVRDIKKTISEREDTMRNVIVLGNPEWKPSLLGLVANSFSDEHNRPVFIWGKEGGNIIKGSCRAGGDVNVVKLMEHASDILVEYGGHKQAGGFSILQENIHLLENRLNEAYDELHKDPAEVEAVYIDKEMTIADINWKLWDAIEKLAPFGMDNPKPLFLFSQSEIVATKQFGKEKNHLEIIFKGTEGSASRRNIQAISFFTGPERFGIIKVGDKVNVVAHVEKSTFRNFPELRLRIVDIL